MDEKTIYKCGKCKLLKTDNVKANGHIEMVVEGYPATCENAGLTNGKQCNKCSIVSLL